MVRTDWIDDEQSKTPVTVEMVRKAVAELSRPPLAGDDECQHGFEDGIHQAVLRAIADGRCDDPAACAGAAMATRELGFARWYA